MSSGPSICTEIEIKLDADPDFTLPDLSQLPGVCTVEDGGTDRLDALYVDSPDLRLAQHGTTFRRRTGGHDQGWHLKMPAAKSGRTELREPLTGGVHDIPWSLIALVRVQLRGARLDPVAHIHTQRHTWLLKDDAGAVLAEVADDLVTADSLGAQTEHRSWREIEVELVHGDEKLLTAARKRLIKAGARAASAKSKVQRALGDRVPAPSEPVTGNDVGSVAVRYLAEQVSALIREDPNVRIDLEDGVHQMRVATRRLRTALATFRPFFTGETGPALRDELKWLAEILGAARDAEVMKAHLRRAVGELEPELVLGPVSTRIELELTAAHQRAHAAVVETLDSERYLALVRALESFVSDPPFSDRASRDAAEELRKRVRKAVQRVEAAVAVADAAATSHERDVELHEVRKAAKRARYAADAAKPEIGKQAKAVAAAMGAIQEDLGDHQDAVVERTWLRDLGVRAFLNGENAFTFGLLHGLTVLRSQHNEQEFARLWRKAQAITAHWPG